MDTLPPHLRAQLDNMVAEANKPEAEKAEPAALPEKVMHRTQAEAFAALDQFQPHAVAGASDTFLASRALTTEYHVRAWRKSRKLPKTKRQDVKAQAMDLFGEGLDPVMHATAGIVGTFSPPEFVLRVPIVYSETCRLMHTLSRLGLTVAALAEAFGFRSDDVEYMLLAEAAHLQRSGVTCPGCGQPTDLSYGAQCLLCKEAK